MSAWINFFIVTFTSMFGACVVVCLYAIGVRLLSTAGKTPNVVPAEFTDAITVITPAEAAAEVKRIRKAAKRNPLSIAQKRFALAAAYFCFIACGAAVLFGIYLIIPALHG